MPAKKTAKKKAAPKTKKEAVRLPEAKKVTKAADSEKERIKKRLIETRNGIIKEAKAEISKFIKGETKQLVDTALDDGDWSVVDLSEDINLRKLSTHKENLNKIDEALRKLEEGSYGICEDCDSEISEERLKVLPFAIYCVECKEKREQLEGFESGKNF